MNIKEYNAKIIELIDCPDNKIYTVEQAMREIGISSREYYKSAENVVWEDYKSGDNDKDYI